MKTINNLTQGVLRGLLGLSVITLGLLGPAKLLAQGENPNTPIEQTPGAKQKEAAMAETQSLFEVMVTHSKKANYTAFARHLVYSGSDPIRRMQELVNYDNTFERLDCEHASNRLREYVSKGELYNLSNFRTLQWMNQDMALWDLDVNLKSGKVKKYSVTFVKIKGKYEYVKVE